MENEIFDEYHYVAVKFTQNIYNGMFFDVAFADMMYNFYGAGWKYSSNFYSFRLMLKDICD